MRKYSDGEFFDCPFRGVTSVLNAIFGNKFENSGIPEHILRAAGERRFGVSFIFRKLPKMVIRRDKRRTTFRTRVRNI